MDLRQQGERITALVSEVRAATGGPTHAKVEEIVQLLMELYGAGLARVLEIAHESGEASTVVERLAQDPLVASLLVLHGLHPVPAEDRIRRALDRLRPHLAAHGGDVTLIAVEGGIARLRLDGASPGGQSSAGTMRAAIERAVEDAAPELLRVDVEGLAPPAPALIQIQTKRPAATRDAADS